MLHAISIHAPRTGSDKSRRVQSVLTKRFQSTLPARGATEAKQRRYNGENHFNPRSPHGERQQVHPAGHKGCCISIHAPRTGRDGAGQCDVIPTINFNPRSPHGERLIFLHLQTVNNYFNPRSPHGERQSSCTVVLRFPHYIFQSTLPARGATFLPPVLTTSCDDFNPRSPHGERLVANLQPSTGCNFNPRSPHGERRSSESFLRFMLTHFNPRSPHGERR